MENLESEMEKKERGLLFTKQNTTEVKHHQIKLMNCSQMMVLFIQHLLRYPSCSLYNSPYVHLSLKGLAKMCKYRLGSLRLQKRYAVIS